MNLVSFVERMNVLLWLTVIFVFHLALYLFLGTERWLFATLAATATYAAVLFLLKATVRRRNKNYF